MVDRGNSRDPRHRDAVRARFDRESAVAWDARIPSASGRSRRSSSRCSTRAQPNPLLRSPNSPWLENTKSLQKNQYIDINKYTGDQAVLRRPDGPAFTRIVGLLERFRSVFPLFRRLCFHSFRNHHRRWWLCCRSFLRYYPSLRTHSPRRLPLPSCLSCRSCRSCPPFPQLPNHRVPCSGCRSHKSRCPGK